MRKLSESNTGNERVNGVFNCIKVRLTTAN